jgi:hypothetical protein
MVAEAPPADKFRVSNSTLYQISGAIKRKIQVYTSVVALNQPARPPDEAEKKARITIY